MKRLMMVLGALVAMATGAWAEDAMVLVAKDVRVEQRFPWNDYVDVRFTISNTLAADTNIIARVRGFYDGQMMLDMDHLYLANADGSPDLSKQFIGGDVFLKVDGSGVYHQPGLKPNEVRLVWDAAKDVPPEAEKVKTLHATVELEPMTKDVEVSCHNGIMVGEAHGIGDGANATAKIVSFLGIPFAHPPTNDFDSAGNLVHIRRWKAPEWAATNREARIEAKRFAPSPLQQVATDEASSSTRRSEDCLYLNIWTGYTDDAQPIKGNEQKPVLVFIHGGSFCQGGTKEALNDCRYLAEKYGDVVFVTIEYRLNLLAQFDFSGLAGWKEEDYPDHGRLCFKDQQMALRWLKANVEKFGGDPNRITISGESAGGVSVTYMMAKYNCDENGEQLFQRAIPMSGAVGSNSRADYTNANHAAVLTEAFRQLKGTKTGFDTIDDFQKATEQELWNALMWPLEKIRAKKIEATPQLLSDNKYVVDLHMMPLTEGREGDNPSTTTYAASGTNIFDAVATMSNAVDLLTGDTGNESRYWANAGYPRPSAAHPDNPFGAFYDGYLPMKFAHDRKFAYTLPEGKNAIDEYIRIGAIKGSPFHEPDDDDPNLNFGFGDLWCKTELLTELQFRMPQIRLAENFLTNAAVQAQGKGCYMYSFEKEQVLPDKPWARAMHAAELPYFFHQPYYTDYGPLNKGLMGRVSEFFIEFVKTGVPKFRAKDGDKARVEAPAYNTKDRPTVVIRDVHYNRVEGETVDVVNDSCTIEVVNDPKRKRRELMMPVSINLPPGI